MGKNNNKEILFTDFFLAGWLCKRFDQSVGAKGFQKATRDLLDKFFCKREIRMEDPAREILGHEPVVLVANHPLAPIIASLPERKDSFFILASEFSRIGPNTSQLVLPIYLEKHVEKREYKQLVKLAWFLKIVPRLHFEEAHERNRESIRLAIERVGRGSLVLISPEGVNRGNQSWLSGLAYLLKGIDKKLKSYYVMVYISAAYQRIRFLDVFPFNKLFLSYKIFFSSPLLIDSLVSQSRPEAFVKVLEQRYKRWVASLPT